MFQPTSEIPLTAVRHVPKNAPDVENNGTPFGAILRGELPARILAETDSLLAFVDRKPQSPTLHALVIPKRYIPTILNVTTDDVPLLYEMKEMAEALVQRYHCADNHRLVFHVPPYNSVDHLHLHVLCNSDLSLKGRAKYFYDTRWCISLDTFLQQLALSKSADW